MAGFIPPQDYALFADESGISNDRFSVVGGICVHRSCVAAIHQNLEAYREAENMHSELKWQKISNQKIEEYKKLVDYFFAMNNTNRVHFHAVIFDNHQWNHKKYNDGDRDIGMSKLYYQLILHKFCKICGPHGSLCVRLDHRNSTTPHDDLKRMLNNTLARDHGLDGAPVKQVLSRDSKSDDVLQMNDVILGAVCSVRNGKHLLADIRPAKREIAQMVLDRSGATRFDRNTAANQARFTVWNFRNKPR